MESKIGHSNYEPGVKDRRPLYADRIVGAKQALKLQQVGAIRFWLSNEHRISNAVLDALTTGWRRVESVDIAISPGSRTPRGLGVELSINPNGTMLRTNIFSFARLKQGQDHISARAYQPGCCGLVRG
jgi:hypothetical protein